MTHLGLAGALEEITGRLADEVEVPIGTTCCGTAGDRGLLHPELVEPDLPNGPSARDRAAVRVVRVPP